MSDKDQFPEREERDDRTIFRPAARPGGAAAAANAPREMTQLQGASEERTIFRPNPGGRRPQAPAAPAAAAPRRPAVQGLDLTAPDANPIMRAASPLLLLLGRLRAALIRAPGSSLIAQIAAAIEKCDREMIAAHVDAAEASAAKFALCAGADEVLAHLPGEDRGASQSGLMTRFFGENSSGRRFFDELDRLERDPRTHYSVLELFHACLALLYQGGRQAPPGSAALAASRSELHALLQKTGPAPPLTLSPRWRGQPLASRAVRLRVPLWTIAVLAALSVFAAFVGFRVSLGQRAETAAESIATLTPSRPVSIARKAEASPAQVNAGAAAGTPAAAVEAPPPPPPALPPTPAQASQLDHIRAVLAPNIEDGTLSVEASANQIVIRIVDKDLFPPGKTAMLASVKPLMNYIALALNDDKTPIKVVGHSDNTPISNARFASNFELSLERAKVVGALLKQNLSQPERVVAEGKGADAPIATNDTPDGRARNRRVEIVVPRSD